MFTLLCTSKKAGGDQLNIKSDEDSISRDHSLRFFNDLQSFYINSDSTSLTYQSSRKDSGTKDLDLKGSTNVSAGLGITGWECWVQLTLFLAYQKLVKGLRTKVKSKPCR